MQVVAQPGAGALAQLGGGERERQQGRVRLNVASPGELELDAGVGGGGRANDRRNWKQRAQPGGDRAATDQPRVRLERELDAVASAQLVGVATPLAGFVGQQRAATQLRERGVVEVEAQAGSQPPAEAATQAQ